MAFQKEKKAVVTEGKNHVKQESFFLKLVVFVYALN